MKEGVIFGLMGAALCVAACSSDGTTSPGSSSNGSSGTTSSASSTSSSGGSSSSSGSTTSSSGGTFDAAASDGVPATPTELNAWLQTKAYQSWPKESAAHASTGPHGSVRTYLNPKLDASMQAKAAEHPLGSVAVKEFYSGQTLSGWAAMIKVEDKSDGGKGWYWYEVFDTAPSATPIQGKGLSTCTGCHGSGGQDFVKIGYPLK